MAAYDRVVPLSKQDIAAMSVANRSPASDNAHAMAAPQATRVMTWRYDIKTDIGRKPQQQDLARVAEIRSPGDSNATVLLAAVCDGHGTAGEAAASAAIDALFGLPNEMFEKAGMRLDTSPAGLSRYMKYAAEEAHARFSSKTWSSDHGDDGGTTMCAAAVAAASDKIIISNIGDSQAMLVSPDGRIKLLTSPHKPATDRSPDLACPPDARDRMSVPGETDSISVSRSIGHTHLAAKCGILPRPTAYVANIADGDVLLIGSDGVWDYYGKGDAPAKLAHMMAVEPTSTFAGLLARIKLDGRFVDNMTALMVRFAAVVQLRV
jgi:serine/threonine protein phosphatase PrpC